MNTDDTIPHDTLTRKGGVRISARVHHAHLARVLVAKHQREQYTDPTPFLCETTVSPAHG
jgi:hypothetical protein